MREPLPGVTVEIVGAPGCCCALVPSGAPTAQMANRSAATAIALITHPLTVSSCLS